MTFKIDLRCILFHPVESTHYHLVAYYHGLKFGGARYHSYCYKLCCEPLQSKLEHMKPTELHHLQKAKIKF